MRHIQTNGLLHMRRGGKGDVAGAAGEIEDPIRQLKARELNQPPFPAPILPIREKAGDEVVAVRDGGEQPADVSLLAFSACD